MKNHFSHKFLSGVFALLLAAALAAPAGAALVGKTIEVLTGVTIYVDGVEMKPTDANGKPVETFVYNGTTYVPLRAVSQSLGYAVNWDGANQRVYIGERPGQKQYLLDVCPPFQTERYSTPATFKMAGDTYSHGFVLDCHGGSALFHLNGQYSTLEFDLAYTDSHNKADCNVNIYLDEQLVENIVMGYEDLPRHFIIPLNGALKMKIENVEYGNMAKYGFANVEIY